MNSHIKAFNKMHVLCLDRKEVGFIASITADAITVSINFQEYSYPADTRDLIAYDLNIAVHPAVFKDLPESEKTHLVQDGPGDGTKIIETPSGFKAHFSGSTMNVIETLRAYPPYVRIELMELNYGQLSDYIFLQKDAAEKKVVELFSKKWTSAETGEKFLLNDDWLNLQIFGLPLTGKQISTRAKKGLFGYETLLKIIAVFEDTNNVREEVK